MLAAGKVRRHFPRNFGRRFYFQHYMAYQARELDPEEIEKIIKKISTEKAPQKRGRLQIILICILAVCALGVVFVALDGITWIQRLLGR
jgi:hypothetical protein